MCVCLCVVVVVVVVVILLLLLLLLLSSSSSSSSMFVAFKYLFILFCFVVSLFFQAHHCGAFINIAYIRPLKVHSLTDSTSLHHQVLTQCGEC